MKEDEEEDEEWNQGGGASLTRVYIGQLTQLLRAFTLAVQDRWMGASETLSCADRGCAPPSLPAVHKKLGKA